LFHKIFCEYFCFIKYFMKQKYSYKMDWSAYAYPPRREEQARMSRQQNYATQGYEQYANVGGGGYGGGGSAPSYQESQYGGYSQAQGQQAQYGGYSQAQYGQAQYGGYGQQAHSQAYNRNVTVTNVEDIPDQGFMVAPYLPLSARMRASSDIPKEQALPQQEEEECIHEGRRVPCSHVHRQASACPPPSCQDVGLHIASCPFCAPYYKCDKNPYMIAIILLSVLSIILLKMVLDKR